MTRELPKTAQAATELFEKLRNEERWTELGWYIWDAFVLLEMKDPVRKAFVKAWDSLTQEQQDIIEESV